MHPNSSASLAAAGQLASTPRFTPDPERAAKTYRAVTGAPGVLARLSRRIVNGVRKVRWTWYKLRGHQGAMQSALYHVDQELLELRSANAGIADAARYRQHVDESIARLWGDVGKRTLEELDLLDAEVEAAENLVQQRRLVRLRTDPAQLRREAETARQSAAIDTERAAVLEDRATEIEGERSLARLRLGLLTDNAPRASAPSRSA